ncbi:hypothetical protein OIV83_005360 [Microbotryomycetes sp. JL201]|nr:hypothetical protein OIV83_005360 [Microbotryomycetes sp. JL201]
MFGRTKNAGLTLVAVRRSSNAASASPAAAPVGPHERQARPRKTPLSQAREDAGETLSLLSNAVKATVQHGQPLSGRSSQQQQRSQNRYLRQSRSGGEDDTHRLGRTLLNARRAQTQGRETALNGDTGATISSSRYSNENRLQRSRASYDTSYNTGSSRTSPDNQSFRARPRSNRDGPRSGQNSQSGPRQPRPQTDRRPTRELRTQQQAADVSPLVAPSKVAYPSLNLASMLREDLESSTAHLKQSVKRQLGSKDSKADPTEEALGDYSRWDAPSSAKDGKYSQKNSPQVMQRAARTLAGNATVKLRDRRELLDKLENLLK